MYRRPLTMALIRLCPTRRRHAKNPSLVFFVTNGFPDGDHFQCAARVWLPCIPDSLRVSSPVLDIHLSNNLVAIGRCRSSDTLSLRNLGMATAALPADAIVDHESLPPCHRLARDGEDSTRERRSRHVCFPQLTLPDAHNVIARLEVYGTKRVSPLLIRGYLRRFASNVNIVLLQSLRSSKDSGNFGVTHRQRSR